MTWKKTAETDFDLIQACRGGQSRAWENVLDRYQRLVFSIPLHYGLSHDDAADIVQITFIILMQSLNSLRDDTQLAPWLSTVARRHTWRLLEQYRRENIGSQADVTDTLSNTADENSQTTYWELLEWLNNGLNALDERCRTLLLALYFEQESPSYTDIASRLGMPVGSIGPTRARCLERMKKHLTT